MKNSIIALGFCLLQLSDVYAQPPARLNKVLVSKYDSNISGYAPWDSTVLYYSGSNRGYLDNGIFFNGYINKLTGVTGNPWTSFTKNMESPHVVSNPELQYDSLLLYQRHLSIGIVPYLRNKQDVANNVITKYTTEEFMRATNLWATKRVLQFTYTNNMVSSLTLNGSTSNYRYVQNTNNLVDSLVVTYSGGQVIIYTYTYNNNLLSELNAFSVPDRYKILYDYNTAGSVTGSTTLSYDHNTLQWDTTQIFNYSYNTGNQLIKEEYSERNVLTTQGLKLLYTIDISYDNNNNRVEDVIHFDYYRHGLTAGLVKVARKQYGYNSFGLISDYEVTHWNESLQMWELGADSLFGPSQKVHLEYSAYWPQDISTMNITNKDLKIFPSPASGFINIRAENMPGGIVEATIYDMQGRIVRQWEDNAETVYERTVPVQELPDGYYVLRLNGQQVALNQKFMISR